MTHTPGPWTVGSDLFISDAEGREIATVSLGSQILEAKDTARLIAAAPQLYEALKAIQSIINGTPDGELPEVPNFIAKEIRAALALVEGDK